MCNLYHPSIDPVIGLSTHWEQMVVTAIVNKEKDFRSMFLFDFLNAVIFQDGRALYPKQWKGC